MADGRSFASACVAGWTLMQQGSSLLAFLAVELSEIFV